VGRLRAQRTKTRPIQKRRAAKCNLGRSFLSRTAGRSPSVVEAGQQPAYQQGYSRRNIARAILSGMRLVISRDHAHRVRYSRVRVGLPPKLVARPSGRDLRNCDHVPRPRAGRRPRSGPHWRPAGRRRLESRLAHQPRANDAIKADHAARDCRPGTTRFRDSLRSSASGWVLQSDRRPGPIGQACPKR
jgi:hypothetical protein